MRIRIQKFVQEAAWLCYLIGAHVILFLPVMVICLLAVITPVAWLGGMDWPLWLKLIMTPISCMAWYVANDLLNDLPRQIDNVYLRWNNKPIRPVPAQEVRPRHVSPRRHHQPRHVKIVDLSKRDEP